MLATLKSMLAALEALYVYWLAIDADPSASLDDLRGDLTDHLRECCAAAGIHWQTLTR